MKTKLIVSFLTGLLLFAERNQAQVRNYYFGQNPGRYGAPAAGLGAKNLLLEDEQNLQNQGAYSNLGNMEGSFLRPKCNPPGNYQNKMYWYNGETEYDYRLLYNMVLEDYTLPASSKAKESPGQKHEAHDKDSATSEEQAQNHATESADRPLILGH
jgi:hypothetical protein